MIKEKNKIENDIYSITENSINNRIKLGCCINYNEFMDIYNKIHSFFFENKPSHSVILLTSESNCGKTTLIMKYLQNNKDNNSHTIFFDCPERALIQEFSSEILIIMGYPVIRSGKLSDLDKKLIKALKEQKIKTLVIDEFDNVLSLSNTNIEKIFNLLLRINIDLNVKLILIGSDNINSFFLKDGKFKSNFRILNIPKFEKDENFRNLLLTFLNYYQISIDPNENTKIIYSKILEYSKGKIGLIDEIMRRSVLTLRKTNSKYLSLNIIKKIDEKIHPW